MKPFPLATIVLAAGLLSCVAANGQTRPSTQPSAPTTAPGRISSEQMLNQMLAPPPASAGGGQGRALQSSNDAPALDKTSGAGAVKPAAPAVVVLREGTIIPDRVG